MEDGKLVDMNKGVRFICELLTKAVSALYIAKYKHLWNPFGFGSVNKYSF